MQSMEIIKNNFSETRNLYVSKLFQTRPKRTFIEKKTMIIYSVIIGFIKKGKIYCLLHIKTLLSTKTKKKKYFLF